MKNYVQRGENITVSAPEPIVSGALAKIGNLVGVASTDAETGETVSLITVGVFALPKVGADDFALGDPVYMRLSDKLVTGTASGNTKIGVAVEAAPTDSAKVIVRLSGAF